MKIGLKLGKGKGERKDKLTGGRRESGGKNICDYIEYMPRSISFICINSSTLELKKIIKTIISQKKKSEKSRDIWEEAKTFQCNIYTPNPL